MPVFADTVDSQMDVTGAATRVLVLIGESIK